MNATTVMTEADRDKIANAVGEAERHTDAEVVCAITTESGRYDRAEAIVGLIVAVIALGAAHGINHAMTTGSGAWDVEPLHIGWQILSVVVGFAAGNLLASYCHPIRRLMVSEAEIDAEVQKAAAHTFAMAAVMGTANRTGLLIYVSLFEHRVVILPDAKVRQALGDEAVAALRDRAVAHLKRGEVAQMYIDLVEHVSPKLSEGLPADRELNPDELANHVLCFHPRPGG